MKGEVMKICRSRGIGYVLLDDGQEIMFKEDGCSDFSVLRCGDIG